MIKKRFLIFLITFVLIISFSACSKNDKTNDSQNNENIGSTQETDPNVTESNVKEIYFLNYDTNLAPVYSDIAKDYEAETGVKVKVVSPEMTKYDTTLKTELESQTPPVIIEIDASGYETYGDRLADLSDTTLYSHLSDQGLSLSGTDSEKGNYGVPYDVEAYGIIVNNAILQKYIALDSKATSITSIDEITNFETLKAVVEDMQKNKQALGIEGVFASMSFAPGEETRWTNQLASVPFHYEFQDIDDKSSSTKTGLKTDTIDFTYGDHLRNALDLYINNSVSAPSEFATKTNQDAINEFALGKCAMIQHGSWIWNEIKAVPGNVVAEENLRMLPLYIGAKDEDKQGLSVGAKRYLAINANVDPELQKAGVNFLEWLFTSEKGKNYVVNQLGFNPPYDTFDDNTIPKDPLKREVNRWLSTDKKSIEWTYHAFPGTGFLEALKTNLLGYAQGTTDWKTFTTNITNAWSDAFSNQNNNNSNNSNSGNNSNNSNNSNTGNTTDGTTNGNSKNGNATSGNSSNGNSTGGNTSNGNSSNGNNANANSTNGSSPNKNTTVTPTP